MSDWEFIFDGVFGFLSSPIWMVPVMSFIEEQSVVFKESEENYLEWTTIHKKYGELIESLLSSYLNDVGITEEQFMQACKTPGVQDRPQLQAVFEQLWATEDFEMFKRMMIQKNVELELQALELVRKRQGKASKKKSKTVARIVKTEEEILAEVMKQSEREYEEHMKQQEKQQEKDAKSEAKFDAAMEKVLSESTKHFERLENEVLQKQEETKQVVEQSLKQSNESPTPKEQEKKSDTKEPQKSSEPLQTKEKSSSPKAPAEPVKSKSPDIQPLKSKTPLQPIKRSAGAEAANDWIKSAQEENKSSSSASTSGASHASTMSEDDMAKRVEYLKQQRDRLLALKKTEREKKLNQYEKAEPSKRPTSARVARQAVAGQEIKKPEVSAEDAKRIAMRKALAAKLKKEVIHR